MDENLIAQIFEKVGEANGKLDAIKGMVELQNRMIGRQAARIRRLEHNWAKLLGITVGVSAVVGLLIQVLT